MKKTKTEGETLLVTESDTRIIDVIGEKEVNTIELSSFRTQSLYIDIEK